MKRIPCPKIEAESYEEQFAAGRYNPAQLLRFKGWRIPLKCGTQDSNCFWAEDSFVFALTYNDGLSYAGLARYELEEIYHDGDHNFITGKWQPAHTEKKVTECGDCFLQYDDLPADFFDWEDIKKLNHLCQYL